MRKAFKIESREIPYIDLFDKRDYLSRLREGWKNGVIPISAAYQAKGGVRSWKNMAKRTPLEQACEQAFSGLGYNGRWLALLAGSGVDFLLDMGPGAGDKSVVWYKHVSGGGRRPDLIFVDLSKPMLRLACQSAVESNVLRAARLIALRAEFMKLNDFRTLLSLSRPSGRAVLLLLGQTIGNLRLDARA